MRYIKVFIYLVIGVIFLISVDFKDLSFKTIKPEAQNKTEINEKPGAGLVRNVKKINNPEKVFEGNEQDIVNLVNQARKKAGLKELIINEKLSLSAMEKAEHMKKYDYFDHISPQGLNPWYFAEKQDYNYKTFGENLAEGYFSADSVHEGWMNSSGHRENVLSVNFEEIGVAVLEIQRDGQKSYLAVQHFGSLLTSEDLVTKIVCDKKSKKNCEEAEDQEDKIENLIEEQEKIIKKAKDAGAGSKDLNRLEENLEELKETEDELEDYIEECEEFLKKCDTFK
jgi:uncharacterized protein YkwD